MQAVGDLERRGQGVGLAAIDHQIDVAGKEPPELCQRVQVLVPIRA